MALAQPIIDRIRDEIGTDQDFTDDQLETIYIDTDRGNLSTLRTAYIVWKRRLANLQLRSFDAASGGSYMARSQRVRFVQRRVKELSHIVDFTVKGVNMEVVPANTPLEGAEF